MAQKPSSKPGKKTATKTRTPKTAPASAVPHSPEISSDEIAERAYRLWESRGKPMGSPDEDWHRAIEELRAGL